MVVLMVLYGRDILSTKKIHISCMKSLYYSHHIVKQIITLISKIYVDILQNVFAPIKS
jgi:hypothetical protein